MMIYGMVCLRLFTPLPGEKTLGCNQKVKGLLRIPGHLEAGSLGPQRQELGPGRGTSLHQKGIQSLLKKLLASGVPPRDVASNLGV
jgi:hypothetical protein